MARTGCAFVAVTCPCTPARTHRDRQVLPAYGLQDLPIKNQNPRVGSNPNTMCLPVTLGENLGGGHFYLAQTRTFLLCVDTRRRAGGLAPLAHGRRFGRSHLKRDKGLSTSYNPAARRTSEHIRLKEQIMRKRRNFVLAALVVVLALAFTSRIGKAAGDPIRVGMIPDAGATQVSVEQKKPLKDYLESAMGQPVELIIPTNYNATVEALGNGSLDFAYLGGLTYLKAHAQYGVTPLVQRQSDQQFHSLFITGAGSSIQSLADLKGKNFAFGDINSTSGHLMPYFALRNAGISVDSDLKFRYTGSHPATAKAVEAGAADAGALDETVFHQVTSNGDVDPS